MKIKNTYLVEKRNVLNEIRKTEMGFQELRFFSIYLSKINSRDQSTRIVKFLLEDFRNIMGLGRLNINHFKLTTDKLLGKVINIDDPDGGYTAFQIFKKCKVYQDKKDLNWYMIIDAHDDALPLLFDFKKEYFTYQVWNILNLKSSNQLRMYEILKQYENIGERKINLDELKSLLGFEQNQYKQWRDFSKKVIKPCQKALLEKTDICFTYETIKGNHSKKITGVKFYISKNKNPVKKISLEDLAKSTPLSEPLSTNEPICVKELNYSEELDTAEEPYNFSVDNGKDLYFQACKREFTESEMDLLIEIASQSPIFSPDQDRKLSICEYLSKKHKELCYRDSKSPIKYRFAYFKKLLEVGKVKLEAELKQRQLEEQLEKQLEKFEIGHKSRRSNYNLEIEPSYDIEAYENNNIFSDSLDQALEKLNVSNTVQV